LLAAVLILYAGSAHSIDWQIEQILDHTGIGSDCDLGIDSAGGLHVSFEYRHGFLGSSAINYAYKSNDMDNWHIDTVDANPGGYTGYDNEIALDNDERPRIVYVWDIDWEYIPYLKHAWFDGGTWQAQQLTGAGEYVQYPTTIGIDAANYSHLMYGDWYGTGPLHHRWESAAGWQEEVVDTGNCSSAHTVIDADDNIHLVYYSATQSAVKYGFNDGSGWSLTTIEIDGAVYATSGMDMVLDGDGYPHVVYRGGNREMRHAWFDDGSWRIEVFHTNALGYPSIAIDQAGAIHSCYSVYTESSNRPLTYSYKPGGGEWITEEVESNVQCWNTALDIDPSGRPHIIYYNYSGGITKHAWGASVTGVGGEPPRGQLVLSSMYPNPSGGRSSVAFELPVAANVELDIYDVRGRKVRAIRHGIMSQGSHVAEVSGLASGVYLVRLRAGGETQTRKLVVLSGARR